MDNFYNLFPQVGGRVIPGPLFDFGLHMFHNSKLMMKEGNGPFFYLPKVMWGYKHYTVAFLLSEQK